MSLDAARTSACGTSSAVQLFGFGWFDFFGWLDHCLGGLGHHYLFFLLRKLADEAAVASAAPVRHIVEHIEDRIEHSARQ